MAVCKYFQKEGIVLIWLLQPNFFIFHERYVKVLLNHDASIDKPLAYDIFSDMVGKSILTLNGSEWKQSKKTLQPLFRFDKLRSSVEILNEKAEIIVKNIAKKGNNSVIDVLPILKIEILKAFCETMLDTKIDDEDTELYEYIKTTSSLGRGTVHRFIQPWLWWKHSLLFYKEGRKQLKQYKELRNFPKKILRNVMQNSDTLLTKNEGTLKQKKKILYSIFSAKLAKDPDFSIRDAEDAINALLFAGHDTTSYAIMWCLFMLGLHPDVQEKAFEEINLVTKESTGFISYGDLKNLKYLECVIKETQRLYPVVPFFARKTTKELKLGNYIVPKNTSVFVVTYLMHRNPDSFPDPEAFNPERFFRDENTVENPRNYAPFAEGIRSCVGKAFAMMEMKIMLAHILRNFKVTSLDKREDILLDIHIVLTPLTPIRFQFSDRSASLN